jgi:hypothetical protein
LPELLMSRRVLRAGLLLLLWCTSVQLFGARHVLLVDEKNRGIAQARLDVVVPDGDQLPPPGDATTSTVPADTRGGIAVPDVATSRALLVFSAPGYALRSFSAAADLPEKITLAPAARLRGSVLDEHGTSMPGVLIGPVLPGPSVENDSNFQPTSADFPPVWTHTGPDGSFVVEGLSAGTYSFVAQAPGRLPKLTLANTGGETTLSLAAGGTTISGLLVGSHDRKPQSNAFVEAGAGLFRLYSMTNEQGQFMFTSMPDMEFQFRTSPARQTEPRRAKIQQSLQGDNGLEVLLLHDEGRTIAGRLVDTETSAPIVGTTVTLAGTATDAISTQTDIGGRFAFAGCDGYSDYNLLFDTSRFVYRGPDGNWRESIEVPSSDNELTTAEVQLLRRAFITGTVTAAGKPAAGATVKLVSESAVPIGPDEFKRQMTYVAECDAAGQFRMGVYPPGAYSVRATRTGAASPLASCEALTTRTAEVALQLQLTAGIVGHVVDADIHPVRESIVRLLTETTSSEQVAAEVRTDAEGGFQLADVPAEPVRITAYHPAFDDLCSTEVRIADAGTTEVTLQFAAAGELQVIVKTDDVPVSSATVQISYSTALHSTSTRTMICRTDVGGIAAFRSIHASEIGSIVVRHPDYQPASVGPLRLPHDGSVNVDLHALPELEVELKSSAGGQQEVLGPVVWLMRSEEGETVDEPNPVTFQAARQERPDSRTVTFRHLAPGWYKAAVYAADQYSESSPLQVTTGTQRFRTEVVVQGSAELSGRVVDDASGEPVQFAQVKLLVQPRLPLDLDPMQTATDTDGRFVLPHTPAGSYVLQVTRGKQAMQSTVKVEAGRNRNLVLRLGADADVVVQGDVQVDGKGLPDAGVILHPVGKPDEWAAAAVSDANGRFKLENLSPGMYTLVVQAMTGGEFHARRISRAYSVSRNPDPLHIRLRNTVTVQGTLHLPRAADTNDPQQRVLSLWFTPQDHAGEVFRTNVSADGSYEIAVEPGPCKVSLFDGPAQDFYVPQSTGPVHADFSF